MLRRAILLVFLSGAILPAAAFGTEPAEDFLRGLKQRGLNELALDYLERMKTSPLVGEEFRRRIPYHRGVVLIEHSRQSADPASRSRLLEQARTELEQFAQDNPEKVEAAEAQMQLGTMQLERGQQLMAEAKKLPSEAAYNAERLTQARDARGHFEDARATFELAAGVYSAELEKLPPTSSSDVDSDQGSKRQEYRSRFAQLRFLAAQASFETAQSFPPDDDEYRSQHESAAKELAAIYEEFARSTSALVGLYARLYEGRCYHALGEHQMALGCYEDLLSQSNVLPPFRRLIASAVHRKAETLTAQEKFDAAIEICRAVLEDAQSDEQALAEWLAVRFRLAEALQKKAEKLTADSLEQRKLLAEARDAYRLVAGSASEYQMAARAAVTALAPAGRQGREEPKSFQAAYDLAKDALASYNAARLALPTAKNNNPEGVPELEAQMQRGKEDARHYFRLATTLIEDDTDLKLVNEVRYFLCWLYWEAGQYFRAAILGEFIARRYPDHPAASSAAKLSMASFEQLYSVAAAGGDDTATNFEARRMAAMAEFITRRWPGTDDADAAFSVLVSFAIRNDRIEEAEKLLSSASEQSRPRLELQLGNAMWARYLELAQANRGNRPDDGALNNLKQSAIEYLRRGFEALRSEGSVSDTLATTSLYLVQALLSDDKYQEAIALLEDKEVGPLTLLNDSHPIAEWPAYVVETYKAALRAYVLVSPPQDEKAVDAMNSLEKAIQASGTDGPAASDQLTRIYVGLGVELQKQITVLRDSGRSRQAERIAAAFAQFLDRIAARQAQAKWPTRVWLAQTYYELGNAQRAGGSAANSGKSSLKPPAGPARDYLVKARDAYLKLLEAGTKDPKLPPNDTAMLAARVQLGECYRALGEFQRALDTFSAVLKEKESSLAVQRAAALAYQERGQAEDAKWLERAIHGGYRLRSSGENRIWGWLKISNVAARASRADQKYRDTFYEARLNVARCRYLAAMKKQGAARKQDLARARQSIQSFAQLYPEMGGERWRGEFQALLKQIEKADSE